MLSLNLDKRNDILYLGLSDTGNSYGEEINPGVVILHDIDSDDITGITIFDFYKRYKSGTLNNISLPINIDFNKDIFKKVCQ